MVKLPPANKQDGFVLQILTCDRPPRSAAAALEVYRRLAAVMIHTEEKASGRWSLFTNDEAIKTGSHIFFGDG